MRNPPGPYGHWFLGNVPRMREDPLSFFTSVTREYGDIVRIRFPQRCVYLITAPDLVKEALVDKPRSFTKESRGFVALRRFLGMGLLTSDGDAWLKRRRIAQPSFHRQKIAGFGASMARAADETADTWERAAAAGRPVDVAAAMMRLTLRIAGETLLSTDVTRDADGVGRAVTLALEDTRSRIYSVFSLPHSLPTPRNKAVAASSELLDRIVYRMIDDRLRLPSGERPNDLLTMLLEARDEVTGEGLTHKELRDEVMTIFLAGHETTANAMSWTFYLLSLFPEAGRKLKAELADVLNGRAPTVEDIPRLRYTTMVFEESMRLYPPVWCFMRAPAEDLTIGGYDIPKMSYVAFSPYATHRRPDLWDDPEGFDPERFAPEREATMPRFAYFPFGGGPRQCIGNAFAMMEGVIILATIARRFRLDLVPGQRVKPEPMITLRPKGEILMVPRPIADLKARSAPSVAPVT